ncbi:FAA1, Long-chain acyl-CoA synthetase [Hydrogenophaga intermedia]|uniref:FAA1, Long-chain acyl-CoA synthetase n=1 Tax=Hydrogenophaga intermedia TaxID=65786 RepID=A0A1L1PK89_HYDIT|nr:DUF1064 domain-containing protein [Hydrogenophaga intermedia]CDN87347.1 FAA1, Long-chain acyl-CoA synthetase [Hydrogenophaga intermedia]
MTRALRLSVEEAMNLQARMAGARSYADMMANPKTREARRQKYGNERVSDRGIEFDSKAEHRRWVYLATLEKAGEIRELRLQVPFELIPAQVAPSGKKHRAMVYVADFTYIDEKGRHVVEDVKGAVTPEFRIKRKLMLQVHGIEVQEVRS